MAELEGAGRPDAMGDSLIVTHDALLLVHCRAGAG